MRLALALALGSVVAGRARAQEQGGELGDPRAGERVFVATPGHVTLDAAVGDDADCEAPCLFHLQLGHYHLEHEIGISGDFDVASFPLVIEAHPRSDLELGLGIAAVGVALGAAAIALGVDASGEHGCVRGGPCDTGLVAVMIPSGVALVIGLVLIFDSGGELSVQAVRRLPGRDRHDE